MPIANVNWLWIGNRAMLDPTPNSSITVAQRNAILNHEATGSDQIEAVTLTGDYVPHAVGTTTGFSATWTTTLNPPRVPTVFSYAVDGTAVTGVRAVSAFAVTMRVQTGPDAADFTDQRATLVQMSNGDLFFRPHAAEIANWAGIDRVHGIKVQGVSQIVEDSYGSFSHTTSFRPEIFDVAFPCFAAGTLIETAAGPVAVERLRVGDLVRTADNGLQPVRWTGSRRLRPADLARRPELRPVRIAAGALGNGLPRRDLLVSPQHRILVRSAIAVRMFGAAEVLVAARHLAGLPGIAVQDGGEGVEYVHFMCDRHEVVIAEGAATETLYAGPQALRTLPPASRAEIMALFPALAAQGAPAPAKPLIPGRPARRLARRHGANDRPLAARA